MLSRFILDWSRPLPFRTGLEIWSILSRLLSPNTVAYINMTDFVLNNDGFTAVLPVRERAPVHKAGEGPPPLYAKTDGFCAKADGFCAENDGFVLQLIDFVLNMMGFALNNGGFCTPYVKPSKKPRGSQGEAAPTYEIRRAVRSHA